MTVSATSDSASDKVLRAVIVIKLSRVQVLLGPGAEIVELFGSFVFHLGIGDLVLSLITLGFEIFAVEDGDGLAGRDVVIFLDQ